MLWLQAHNLEINWKIEKVKMTRCPPLCRRNMKSEEGNKIKKGKKSSNIRGREGSKMDNRQ